MIRLNQKVLYHGYAVLVKGIAEYNNNNYLPVYSTEELDNCIILLSNGHWIDGYQIELI